MQNALLCSHTFGNAIYCYNLNIKSRIWLNSS